MTLNLSRDGDVFVLDFGNTENMTTQGWVDTMHQLLDDFDAADGTKALITTGSGKHYSNGLDVDYMRRLESADATTYVRGVIGVVQRLMMLGAPTVAAVNGHGFGMGAFLTIAHDHAVMREDRGYICFPEVHLDMVFGDELLEIAQSMLTPRTMRQALATGYRYSGPEAVEAGMVDATAAQADVLSAAKELATKHAGTAGPTLAKIKRQLMPDIAARLNTT